MNRRKYIYISALIGLTFIVSLKIFINYVEKNADTKIVCGSVANYTYYDRKITVADFLQFDHNSTYEEMVECLGKENGRYGYGGAWPYYELSDGTYAICSCLLGDRMRAIIIVDKKKKLYTLLEATGQIYGHDYKFRKARCSQEKENEI